MFFFNHCCNNECNRCVKCCRPVERDECRCKCCEQPRKCPCERPKCPCEHDHGNGGEFRCSCMCYRKQNGCGGGCGGGDRYCD